MLQFIVWIFVEQSMERCGEDLVDIEVIFPVTWTCEEFFKRIAEGVAGRFSHVNRSGLSGWTRMAFLG